MGAYVDHLVRRRLMRSRQRFRMEREAMLVLMEEHMHVNLVCAVCVPVPVSYGTSEFFARQHSVADGAATLIYVCACFLLDMR